MLIVRQQLLLSASILGCSALRAGEGLQTFSSSSSQGSCDACSDLVHFHRHESISWEIFPPQPFPGVDIAITCIPSHQKRWGFKASDQVEHLLNDEDCGVEKAALNKRERKNCKGLYDKQNKRASFLGLPVAFMQQLAVCGRCTICEAFAKVRGLWQKLKAAAQRVVKGIIKAKRTLFGFSYASSEVRTQMKERFDTYFPEVSVTDENSDSSLMESSAGWEDEHEKMVHDALMKQLQNKPPEQVEQHLSLLQRRLDEAKGQEEELLLKARKELQSRAVKQRESLETQLPTLLGNKHCKKLVESSLVSQVLTITLYVELPHIANAILGLVMGNLHGALHALIPEVYLHTAPHLGGDVSAVTMNQCLKALHKQRQPFLDSCTHEQPLLACAARTYQRLMEGALSQQWWPLKHNEKGTTVGSIDLGYEYDALMKSLECTTQGSCLETSVVDLEKEEIKVATLEKESTDTTGRMEQLQCAFAGSRVDTEDGEEGDKLPIVTDKIWAAALGAFGWTHVNSETYHESCPSVLPFVTAFCANDLGCMDADNAGQGFLSIAEFELVKRKSREHVEDLQHITAASVADKTEELDRLNKKWDDMMLLESNFWGADQTKDVYHWNLMWQTANLTSKVGLLATWPEILNAVVGESEHNVNWQATIKYWEKVLQMASAKMQVRALERQRMGQDDRNKQSIAAVLTNLHGIFETKFCSPGALGKLSDQDMLRLGMTDDVSRLILQMDDMTSVVKRWKQWTVFNIKVKASSRKFLNKFKKKVKRGTCSCMCYRSCGKLKASASNSCNAGFLADPSGLRQKNLKERKLITFWPDKVVVDRVYAIGAVYKKPQMTIYKLVSPGACKYRFEMMGQIVSKLLG
ncbi:unnamed protein product [Durusdinium trenchii]|uniref:Uncharacterized protein n=1 Tax=Durusdinium trenchii TaxID=1381693 RepID=A0ABP0PMB2_9DINO